MIWQTDLYDRIDQASLLRGEQLLKIQSLHTSSVDGGVRYFFDDLFYCSCSMIS